MTPDEIARTAWRVETEQLGQQSGIQDQLAAAYGGVNLIRIERYPDATVEHLDVPASVLAEFERRRRWCTSGRRTARRRCTRR